MVGNCAKKIAMDQSDDKDIIDNSFIAGLLHDIGKLVMLAKMDKQYEEATLLAGEEGISLRTAEKQIFNAVHDDFGAYLMGLWGMPGPVIEAIGFHHRLDNYPDNQFNPAVAVHLANAFYYEKYPDPITDVPHAVDISHLKTIGLEDRIEPWRELCYEILDQEGEL
jgi:HD-like signal output (HDOD) protein